MKSDRRSNTPTRTCVGCGRRDRQSAMVRLRRDASGRITTDVSVRTGRSAYVHGSGQCVQGLLRSKVLGKSLRQNVAKETRQELVSVLQSELASGSPSELASVSKGKLASVSKGKLASVSKGKLASASKGRLASAAVDRLERNLAADVPRGAGD